MNDHVENASFVALIDDDLHSAQLLTRMLVAHGSPKVSHYGNAHDGLRYLTEALANPQARWPGLVIVDLKSHSQANIEFLQAIQPLAHKRGINAVAMIHPGESGQRDALEDSGATAIFFRHADRDAYRREAASLVSFWARHQRLDAVGM